MRILTAVFLFCLSAVAAAAQTEVDNSDEAARTAEIAERAGQALGTLRDLIENRTKLTEDVAALEGESDLDDETRTERRAALKAEIAELDTQIGAVTTGVSDTEWGPAADGAFDLNAEMQALVEPFVTMMRDATENARQIERLRRDLGEAQRRQALAEQALETLSPVEARATGDEVTAEVARLKELWAGRADASADLVDALQQQLDDRLSDRGATRVAAGRAASSFVRDRGTNLLLGVGAFILVFAALRLIHRAATWARRRRGIKRSLYTRLGNLIFTAATPVLAVGAMLAVFNAQNDWLLMGIFAVMLLALLWIGVKMIPEMVDQVTLLLNLGAVQEDERVVIDGVPYRVRRLDFYTDFDNPDLEGASFTVPIKELIGQRSRPPGPNEPWFPTRTGDWVRLADETFGQIVSQSPEMVEIEIPGNSRMTYATADFLAEKPDNLSTEQGYRAEITFGLSYDIQAIATHEVMEKLKAFIRAGLAGLVKPEQLRAVGIELLEAGDNAIIYEVEADLTGDAGRLMEDVERRLAKLCIDAATEYGWEIPFPQLTVHQR